MEFEVEIEVGSIQFLVSGYLDEGVIDCIDKLSVWNGEQYREIEFDSDHFINVYGDYVLEALREQEDDARIAAAEMRYDAAKEEGIL